MSEAPHGAPIKTPGQLIAAIIASFAVPIVIIVLLVIYVDNSTRTGAGTDSLSDAEVSARIKPFAQVDIRDANAPRVYKTGEEVYKAVCSACHASGAAGAPKFTNTADWAPRIAQGFDTLLHTALTGKGAMPARGGTSPDDYSDFEIARAVAYMANNSGASFPEPAQPAAGAAAAASGAAAAAPAALRTLAPHRPLQRWRPWQACRKRLRQQQAGHKARTPRKPARRCTSRFARRVTRPAC